MRGFAGTRTLTLLALRRDRWMLPAWVLTFTGVTYFSAVASKDIYATQAELETAAKAWNSTLALVAIHGRIYDPSSLGAASMIKMTGMGTAFIALLSILLVIRHTRADEEVGRYELAAAGEVGRYAAVTAALIISVGTVFTLSLLSGLSLIASGLSAAGSVAFFAAWAGAGLVFAGVGAVAAQLATTARASRGLGATALTAFYVIRAVGDTSADGGHRWVSWLSPLGWAQQLRPFAGDRWVALAPAIVLFVALLVVTAAFLHTRDLGAGLLADRPGPPTGPRLVSPLALAWRQHRFALLGWAVGVASVGLLLGGIASTIGQMFDNPQFKHYLELLGGVSKLEDAFLSTELGISAIVCSAFGISAAIRMRTEEAQGRAEALLATGTSRTSYAASHLLVGLFGTTALLTVTGLAVGTSHAIAVGDSSQVLRVLEAALARLPAAWVMTALVMALFGISGRLTVWAWVALVGIVVIGEFGPLMKFPDWTQNVSPFAHVPSLPGSAFTWTPMVWLSLVAVALTGLGLTAFRRRDLQPD